MWSSSEEEGGWFDLIEDVDEMRRECVEGECTRAIGSLRRRKKLAILFDSDAFCVLKFCFARGICGVIPAAR